ncbi:tRNA lysidine(34) synthetase TilS [Gemmatimonadota bacterium]
MHGQCELTESVGRMLEEHSMVGQGDRVLVAVSAGLDSMVMLEILYRLSARMKFDLCVAHFDHGLRGLEAARTERELVERRCRELGVEFNFGHAEVAVFAAERKLNLQDAARRLRYEFFWKCYERCGCTRLATGHHRDDQAETVLIRLLSGSGLVGLAGIPLISEDGNLIRPLLKIPRMELERFASLNRVTFAEDASNQSLKYLRNRVRHRIIPGIEKKFDPSFRENLVLLATEAESFRRALEERADALRPEIVTIEADGSLRINCKKLEKISPIVRRYLLRSVVFKMTGGKVILSAQVLAAVERLAFRSLSGHALDLTGGLRANREFEDLIIASHSGFPPGSMVELPAYELPEEGARLVMLGSVKWEVSVIKTGPESFPGAPTPEEPGPEGWYEQWFDLEGLTFPLTIGTWSAGGKIRPFGLGGTKKVKKIFLEKRIPLSSRDEVPVVRDSCSRVIWLCGVARSEYAPVLPGALKLLRIRLRRI